MEGWIGLLAVVAILFVIFRIYESVRNWWLNREERKAEKAELEQIRQKELVKALPSHMVRSLERFEAEVRSGKDHFLGQNDFSPLACFGYKVGKTNGLPEKQRREVIYYTWYAELPDVLPQGYVRKWGGPGSYKRYLMIMRHLEMLANQRRSRRNYHVAVAHWDADRKWFQETYGELANKYFQHGWKS
ncbi:hypothetical protein [Thioalkalivibrio sp. ALgr3]|uniref:hypothetical protein n=1 Tax=Thioalkalivibrio sp. ALgr3 TaxID=1239292 RepID=UPI0012DC8FD9|nr:hypothetical protein [Thioalkalivibrio sp. ALgr3]